MERVVGPGATDDGVADRRGFYPYLAAKKETWKDADVDTGDQSWDDVDTGNNVDKDTWKNSGADADKQSWEDADPENRADEDSWEDMDESAAENPWDDAGVGEEEHAWHDADVGVADHPWDDAGVDEEQHSWDNIDSKEEDHSWEDADSEEEYHMWDDAGVEEASTTRWIDWRPEETTTTKIHRPSRDPKPPQPTNEQPSQWKDWTTITTTATMHWSHTFTYNHTWTETTNCSTSPTSTSTPQKWYPLLAQDAQDEKYVLGAGFLRSVYAMYDLEGQRLYMASIERNPGASDVRSLESTTGSDMFDPPLDSDTPNKLVVHAENAESDDKIDSGRMLLQYFGESYAVYAEPTPGVESVTATIMSHNRDGLNHQAKPVATTTLNNDDVFAWGSPDATVSFVGAGAADSNGDSAVLIDGSGQPITTVEADGIFNFNRQAIPTQSPTFVKVADDDDAAKRVDAIYYGRPSSSALMVTATSYDDGKAVSTMDFDLDDLDLYDYVKTAAILGTTNKGATMATAVYFNEEGVPVSTGIINMPSRATRKQAISAVSAFVIALTCSMAFF